MNKIIKNHGFIPDAINNEDYIFGAKKLPEIVLQENGQWANFLPISEVQEKNGLETYNCTSYGTLNCLEILFKRQFGKKMNWSERFNGVVSGTTQSGNSPQNAVQAIRHNGVVDEELLPFDDSIDAWDEYYCPNPMSENLLEIGKKFLEGYEIGHEWVFVNSNQDNSEKLMEALKYSPLGVSVFAWNEGEDGIYIKEDGDTDNHWTSMFGYEFGKYWLIWDSYDNTIKKLAWDYKFGFAKRYSIKKKSELVRKFNKNILADILFFLKRWLFN